MEAHHCTCAWVQGQRRGGKCRDGTWHGGEWVVRRGQRAPAPAPAPTPTPTPTAHGPRPTAHGTRHTAHGTRHTAGQGRAACASPTPTPELTWVCSLGPQERLREPRAAGPSGVGGRSTVQREPQHVQREWRSRPRQGVPPAACHRRARLETASQPSSTPPWTHLPGALRLPVSPTPGQTVAKQGRAAGPGFGPGLPWCLLQQCAWLVR